MATQCSPTYRTHRNTGRNRIRARVAAAMITIPAQGKKLVLFPLFAFWTRYTPA